MREEGPPHWMHLLAELGSTMQGPDAAHACLALPRTEFPL